MDPNAWQQYRWAAAQAAQGVPVNRLGLSQALLEQSGVSSLTPPLTASTQSVHSMPSVTLPTLHAHPSLDTSAISGLQPAMTAESFAKLPPLSSMTGATSGYGDPQNWNLANWLKRDTETVEPPPAHTGQRATSMQPQNPYRPQATTQAEQNLFMDHFELIRQQLQQLQDPVPSKPSMTSSTLKYTQEQLSTPQTQLYQQEPVQRETKYSDQLDYQDSVYKFQPPVQKYQEPIADNKYKRENDYPKRPESQSRYAEVPHAHSKQVSQVRGYSGYTDNSPSSHHSSPQVPHSSPSIAYTSSPVTQQAYGIYSQPAVSNSYRQTTTEPTYGTAASMYEAVSPAAQSVPSYGSVSMKEHQSILHSTPSPQINPYAHLQGDNSASNLQNSQIVQAPADSTTKTKKGRTGKGSSSRSGGSASRTKQKKKSQEAELQAETQAAEANLQHQLMQQNMAMHPSAQHALLTTSAMSGLEGTTLHIPTVSMTMQHHPGLDNMQPLYELPAAQYSEDMLTQVHMAHELLGINHQEIIRADDQVSVFGTPNMGQGFESPVMEDMGRGTPTVEDNLGLGFATLDYRKNKQRTKAEQKEMPHSMVSRELDDEFGHLSRDPEVVVKQEPVAQMPLVTSPGFFQSLVPGMGDQLSTQPHITDLPEQKHTPSPVVKTDTSFQTSFLSFIQGNKQETLSSVTNSAIVKKPELPKYIPEPPRPKPKPRPPEPMRRAEPKATSPKKPAGSTTKSKADAVTFSDDDTPLQARMGMAKVVQGVISHLGSDEKNQGTTTKIIKKTAIERPTFATQSAPLKLKIKMSNITMPVEKERSSKSRKRSSGGSKSRRKSGGKHRINDDEYEVVHLDVDSAEEVEQKELPQIPARERSSRRAKEKTEAKRRKRQEKKKKTKKLSYEDEDEEFVVSSDGGIIESGSEKAYDSDKDPGWQPTVDDFMGGGGISMAEVGMHKKQRSRSFHKSGRPRSSGKKRRFSGSDDELEYESGEEPLVPTKKAKVALPQTPARYLVADCDSDDNSPHHYNKGDFVMEKKELCCPDKFVIWKIDAGKLIQKYEPSTLDDGRIVHKSLSTYSSWSDYLKPNYIGVETEVVHVSGKSQEMVRVLDKYRPLSSDEKLEKHTHMESFNVFVQVLLSEALEPGFLVLIQNPGDFDYYLGPLKEIENKLQNKQTAIHETVKWQASFKEVVDKFPLLRVVEKYIENEVTCQASEVGAADAGKKEAKLYGDIYDLSTLNRDAQHAVTLDDARTFMVGLTASEHLRRYHRLHHFKFRMYKKCLYMVECCKRGGSKETSDILDQCLQNRIWVQLLFREYIELLQDTPPNATETPPTATETPPSTTETPPTAMETAPLTTETPPSATETAPYTTETPPSTTETPPNATETAPYMTETPPSTNETAPSINGDITAVNQDTSTSATSAQENSAPNIL